MGTWTSHNPMGLHGLLQRQCYLFTLSPESPVGTATDYCWVPRWGKRFLSLQCLDRHWGSPCILYIWYRVFLPRPKTAETRSWLLPSSAEDKNDGSYLTPPYVFMPCWFINYAEGKLYHFTFYYLNPCSNQRAQSVSVCRAHWCVLCNTFTNGL
jgi:hypothetical protein